MPQKYVVHPLPASGDLALAFAKSAVQRVSVSGVDLLLTLADGSQHLLPGLALKVMTDKLRIAFSDVSIDAAELLGAAGRVVLGDMVTRTASSAGHANAAADPPSDPNAKSSKADEAAAPADAQADAPPIPATGMTPVNLGGPAGQEASYNDKPPPAPPPQIILPTTAPYSAPPVAAGGSNNNPPPPPPPPAERVSIGLDVFNVTGQQTVTLDGGKIQITGAGGVPASATDSSPAVQAAREQIVGTSAADELIGDGAGDMGSGFARVLEIHLAARDALEVRSVTISGVPAGYVLLGATRLGDSWQLDLTGAVNNTLRIVVQYPVASDDEAFTPRTFNLTIAAAGLMAGELISGSLVVPVIVRDVTSAADMNYSAGGLTGFVLPAFGLGDEIRAGGGNDVVRGLVGHDLIYGDAGNDTLDGGAGRDTLIGGAGADVLIGGSGIDTADYSASPVAVTVDLVAGTGSGGDAEGDTLTGIENLTGSVGNDALLGDAGTNRLDGGAGDDRLTGRGGADVLIGGDGIDTTDYAGSTAGVNVNLTTGQGSSGDARATRSPASRTLPARPSTMCSPATSSTTCSKAAPATTH